VTNTRGRTFGTTGLGLPQVGSFRQKLRASSRGPRTAGLRVSAIANHAIDVDLLARAYHPDGDAIKLRTVGTPRVGQAAPAGGGTVRYTSPKLYLGEDEISFELADSRGAVTRAKLVVEIGPNPTIGIPFQDGTFFSDETGWAVS
jgi:hypothetical protein